MYLVGTWKDRIALVTLEKLEMKTIDYQIVKAGHHLFRKTVVEKISFYSSLPG